MYDDKWPQLTVVGPPVTPEQAEQILIRTDGLMLACNDRAWQAEAHRIITGTEDPWMLPTVDERLAALRAEYEAKQRLGILTLAYLDQERVVNSAKGSACGWCDWDGTIGARPYNIGKWPSEGEITSDWEQITEAFPFLRLRSQVTSFSDASDPPRVWGTWTVRDGTVSFDEDATEPLELGEVAPWAPGQQPLPLERLAEIVDRVRAVTPERTPPTPRVRTKAASGPVQS